MKTFKAVIYQFTPKLGDKLYNLNKVINILQDVEADIFVLPEFFSTGVCHEAFIESPENSSGGVTIDALRDLAIKTKTNIVCGTVIEKDKDKLYNTCFVLNRSGGTAAKYRKIHLFNMYGGSEDKRITRGQNVVTAPLDIGNVGLSICFDIRFPSHFLALKKMGADFFVCPTAWGYSNDYKNAMNWAEVWKSFNISRANENNIPLISANQISQNPSEFYCIGKSMMTDKDGNIVSVAADAEQILSAIIK